MRASKFQIIFKMHNIIYITFIYLFMSKIMIKSNILQFIAFYTICLPVCDFGRIKSLIFYRSVISDFKLKLSISGNILRILISLDSVGMD